MKLTDFDALTFDCYGTLIDWESGMIEALKPLTSKTSRKLTRDDILEAHARRILAASSDADETLSRSARDRLSPPRRGMGRRHKLERLRRLRPVDPELAGLRRYRRVAQYLEATLQARDPVERRQRKFFLQQRKVRASISTRSIPRRIAAPTSPRPEISTTCSPSSRRSGSRRARSSTPPRAFSMTTGRRTSRALPRAGFIGDTARRAPARQWRSPRRPVTTFASRAWRSRQSASGSAEGLTFAALPTSCFSPAHLDKPPIVYDDFAKVDMRVGRIVTVKPFERARNPSYKVEVDFGPLGRKWSSAQITSYSEADLVGRLVVCVVNMPPRNIAGFQSEVLILGRRMRAPKSSCCRRSPSPARGASILIRARGAPAAPLLRPMRS